MENIINGKEAIIDYVAELVKNGANKTRVKDQLMAVGWSEDQVDLVYSKALIQNGIPVPSKIKSSANITTSISGKKSSTVEVALNLFSFILLGIIAIATGTLFYQIINKYFPDTLITNYYQGQISTETIHYAIATLIIGFPIYYISMRLWFRGFQKDEGKRETKLTKWLTYLVLLIASITVVGDLITAVFTFLQGEISVRFFLKALTILAIAGAIFGFYFLERRKIQYRKPISQGLFKRFGIIVSATIFIGIILGFIVGGSPTTERKRGFDAQREKDLFTISNCVSNYARRYKRLPESLNELQTNMYSYCANKKDPETKKVYEYHITTASKIVGTNREGTFELCANFNLKSEKNNSEGHNYYSGDGKWEKHNAGKNCDKVNVIFEKFNRNQ